MVKLKRTLEDRLRRAEELRAQGYNCSQCVSMVFDDIHNIPQSVMETLSAPLGGGVGGSGQICGVVTGMALVESLHSYSGPKEKAQLYGCVRTLSGKFCENNGSTICHELKNTYKTPCNLLIADGIRIMHSFLESE